MEFNSVWWEEQLDIWIDGLAHGPSVKGQVTVPLHERFEALVDYQLDVFQTCHFSAGEKSVPQM